MTEDSITPDIRQMPEWKQEHARPIFKAVYNAAIGMSDDEIAAVVKSALLRARRDLSS